MRRAYWLRPPHSAAVSCLEPDDLAVDTGVEMCRSEVTSVSSATTAVVNSQYRCLREFDGRMRRLPQRAPNRRDVCGRRPARSWSVLPSMRTTMAPVSMRTPEPSSIGPAEFGHRCRDGRQQTLAGLNHGHRSAFRHGAHCNLERDEAAADEDHLAHSINDLVNSQSVRVAETLNFRARPGGQRQSFVDERGPVRERNCVC